MRHNETITPEYVDAITTPSNAMGAWFVSQEYECEIYWALGIHTEWEGVGEIYCEIMDCDLNCSEDNYEYHTWTGQEDLTNLDGGYMQVWYDTDADWCYDDYHGWYWCTDEGEMIVSDTCEPEPQGPLDDVYCQDEDKFFDVDEDDAWWKVTGNHTGAYALYTKRKREATTKV